MAKENYNNDYSIIMSFQSKDAAIKALVELDDQGGKNIKKCLVLRNLQYSEEFEISKRYATGSPTSLS